MKVPPWYSSGASLPALARAARSPMSALICMSPFAARLTMGVMSPAGVATATATSTDAVTARRARRRDEVAVRLGYVAQRERDRG